MFWFMLGTTTLWNRGKASLCRLTLMLWVSTRLPLPATDYFVCQNGDDGAKGTSTNAPWRTIDRVNHSRLQPGDRVLFEAGTSFEALPDDWVCPMCGASKDDFSPSED